MTITRHVFLTEPGFRTTRWQHAFAEAVVVDSIDAVPELVASDMVWVLTGVDGWQESIGSIIRDGATVIAMTRQPDMDELRAALSAGARGYVHALSAEALLMQAAQAVHSGSMWLPAEVVNSVVKVISGRLDNGESRTTRPDLLSRLTQRERLVAEAVASGLSNKEVARELDITDRTVKAHLSSAFQKLDVRDRMQLVVKLRTSTERDRDVG